VWPLIVTNMIAAVLTVAPGLPLALLTVPAALAAAVLVGLPALWFALAIGLRGEITTTLFGAVVGVSTPYIALIALTVSEPRNLERSLSGVQGWFLFLCAAIGGVSAGLYWAFNLAPSGLRFWRAVRAPLIVLVSCWLTEAWTIASATLARH
jgi:hypothetical protein